MVDEINTPVASDTTGSPAAPSAPVAPVAPVAPTTVKIKEPILSALLSFVLSGLGQIYNGQVKKGLCFLVLDFLFAIGLIFLIFGGSMIMGLLTFWAGGLGMCCCFPFIFLPFLWRIYFMYDAYKVAVQINQGGIVQDWFS